MQVRGFKTLVRTSILFILPIALLPGEVTAAQPAATETATATAGTAAGATATATANIVSTAPGLYQAQKKVADFTRQQAKVLSNKYCNAETEFYELSMGVTGLIKARLTLVRDCSEIHERFYAGMRYTG